MVIHGVGKSKMIQCQHNNKRRRTVYQCQNNIKCKYTYVNRLHLVQHEENECKYRISKHCTKKKTTNIYYIHIKMMGLSDDIIIFKTIDEMTVKNTLERIKSRIKCVDDELYLINELYGNEKFAYIDKTDLQLARTYLCKRRPKTKKLCV